MARNEYRRDFSRPKKPGRKGGKMRVCDRCETKPCLVSRVIIDRGTLEKGIKRPDARRRMSRALDLCDACQEDLMKAIESRVDAFLKEGDEAEQAGVEARHAAIWAKQREAIDEAAPGFFRTGETAEGEGAAGEALLARLKEKAEARKAEAEYATDAPPLPPVE